VTRLEGKVWVVASDSGQCEALGLPYAVADLRDEAAATVS
jgi:hypothetical protein